MNHHMNLFLRTPREILFVCHGGGEEKLRGYVLQEDNYSQMAQMCSQLHLYHLQEF